MVKGTGTRHTVETVEIGRERGGKRTAWAMSCHTMKPKRTPPVRTPCYSMLQSTSMWNSDTCAYVSTPLTSRGMQALFVVNSVKLHLTALNVATCFQVHFRCFPRVHIFQGFFQVPKTVQTLIRKNPDNCIKV